MTNSHVKPPRVWPSRQPSIGAARFFANLSQECSAAEYCGRILLSDDGRGFEHARGVKYFSKVFDFGAVICCPFYSPLIFRITVRSIDAHHSLNGVNCAANVLRQTGQRIGGRCFDASRKVSGDMMPVEAERKALTAWGACHA